MSDATTSTKQVPAEVQLQAAEHRHSYYALSDKSPVSDEKLREIVFNAVKHVPTSFNNQTTGAALVLGEKHQELWKLVKKSLQDKHGEENAYIGVIDFSALKAYGTVLFFINQDIITAADNNANFAPFKGKFDVWAEHSTGMLQYVVWSALEGEGLGASLQHHTAYAQETNDAVTGFAGMPQSWKVTGLMPFGTPTGPPGGHRARTYDNLDERFKVVQ